MRVKVVVPAGLNLTVENERALLEALGRAQASNVRMRAIAQMGVSGALPRPRDGGLAWHESGALLASIGTVSRVRRGRPEVIVRPLGQRIGRDFGAAVKRARESTKRLRAAAVLGAALQSMAGASSGGGNAKPAGKVKLSKLRRRAVVDNAGLAAVLSKPDPRPGRRTNRYVVMGASKSDEQEIETTTRRLIRVGLTETKR